MKTIIIILSVLVLIGCSGNELSKKEKLEQLIDNYIQEKFKQQVKNDPEIEGSIALDSLWVMDTITKKKELAMEILELKRQAQKLIEDGKNLAAEYQEKKYILGMYNDLSQGTDSFSASVEHDLEKLRNERDAKLKQANELKRKMESNLKSFEVADSIQPLYYYVFAHYTVIDKKINKKGQIVAPFHISMDFMIIKEPEEILKERRGE
jgi:hypothetical protein